MRVWRCRFSAYARLTSRHSQGLTRELLTLVSSGGRGWDEPLLTSTGSEEGRRRK